MILRHAAITALLLVIAGCSNTGGVCCTVSITVDVPSQTPTVYLTGNLTELGPWQPDGLELAGEGLQRSVSVHVPAQTGLEYKFTLGTWDREALSEAGTVPANHRLSVDRDLSVRHTISAFKKDPLEYIADWAGSGVEGRLVYWTGVSSAFLGPTRHVAIWLPPGYDADDNTRYPVLYMSDGQNLFDPRIASTGTDWGVDETMVRLSTSGVIRPAIVVGVWNTAERVSEYSPWHNATDYARFLIEELKPRIDNEFRTLTGPEDTATMGSSMGGLLSWYLVTYHGEVFGACGCISTHFPLSEAVMAKYLSGPDSVSTPDSTPYILRDIAAGLTVPRNARYWFDYGGKGLDAGYGEPYAAVRDWMTGQAKIENVDFVIREYPDADHNEASWRARLQDPLRFLFAKDPGT